MRSALVVVILASLLWVPACKRSKAEPVVDPDRKAVLDTLAGMDAALAGGDIAKIRLAFHDVGVAAQTLAGKMSGAAALGFGRILVEDVETFRGTLEATTEAPKLKEQWDPIAAKLRKAL